LRFIAFRILEELLYAKGHKIDPSDVRFGVQVRAYIDDFVVARGSSVIWYEMKSGDTVNWDTGRHTIADNYFSQIALDLGRKLRASYKLVVPRAETKEHLDGTSDHRTKHDVEVIVFPNTGHMDDIEILHPWFPQHIEKLIPLNASRYDFQELYIALQGQSLNIPNNLVCNLTFIARESARKYKGAFSYGLDKQLDPRAEALIRGIPGMAIAVCGDQLHFSCADPEVRGRVLGCNVGSASGKAFEAAIISRKPKTWDELSGLLWRNYGGS
jgi:hypothetical protein